MDLYPIYFFNVYSLHYDETSLYISGESRRYNNASVPLIYQGMIVKAQMTTGNLSFVKLFGPSENTQAGAHWIETNPVNSNQLMILGRI